MYQSPEHLDARKVSPLSDVYSFGVLLVELFGEKRVWEGMLPSQICSKVVVRGEFPSVDHIDHDGIQNICQMCLTTEDRRCKIFEVLESIWTLTLPPSQ